MGSVNLGFGAVSIDLVLFLVAAVAGLLLVTATAAPDRRRGALLLMRIILIGVIAARAFHVYLDAERYGPEPWTAGRLTDGGFIVFAGFVAAAAATAWYAWRNRALRQPLVLAVAGALLIWGGGLNVFWLLRTDQLQFPTFTLIALDDKPVKVEDFLGRPIVVNLWATWCPPCRREMPVLGNAQQRHGDITFLFVNQGESGRLVREYLDARAPQIRNVLLDVAGQFPVHAGTQALPVTLFFSDRGILHGKHVGELTASTLEQNIASLKAAGITSRQTSAY